MKSFLTITFFFLSYSSFADAGRSYRFNLELVSKNGNTLNGYFYHHSYDKYDKDIDYDERFIKFINKDSIAIYSFITTKNIGSLTLDFTANNYKKNIDLNNYQRIRINDYLDSKIMYRLIELTKEEFTLIEDNNPKIEFVYNEKVAENCNYVLLSWKLDSELLSHKKEISDKMVLFSKNTHKNQYDFYKYLNLKKERLFEDSILLIDHCTAL